MEDTSSAGTATAATAAVGAGAGAGAPGGGGSGAGDTPLFVYGTLMSDQVGDSRCGRCFKSGRSVPPHGSPTLSAARVFRPSTCETISTLRDETD